MLGNNISNNSKFTNSINGLTISPKKNFCIIKIWNGDKKQNNLSFLNKIEDLPFDTCIYKEHKVTN